MKRIIVTPAGRKRYMEILSSYLDKQRSDFDEWHIWQNTENIEDIEFFKTLNAKIIISEQNHESFNNLNIINFYPIDSIDIDSLYLRLDDDIVWMEPNFINKMFECREKNTDNFLIFANIINNCNISHLHMRFGSIPWEDLLGYQSWDPFGWGNPKFAEKLHEYFLSQINNYSKFYFSDWNLYMTERVSVNAISWKGSDFLHFNGLMDSNITKDEEEWLTKFGPLRLQKRSVIYGQCLCSHYAYFPQREYMDTTNILSKYKNLV